MSVDLKQTGITVSEYGIRNNGYVPFDDPFYNNGRANGVNGVIVVKEGAPRSRANVLCNCVGFANGAFNEACWYRDLATNPNAPRKQYYRITCEAKNIIKYAQNGTIAGLKDYIVQPWEMPPVGGLIVWGDGMNHVAYIAEVKDINTITIVQAGWNTGVWTQTANNNKGYVCDVRQITRNNGGFNKWAYSEGAKSKRGSCVGFIRNPKVDSSSSFIGPLPLSVPVYEPPCGRIGTDFNKNIGVPYIYINGKWVKAYPMMWDGDGWVSPL